MVDSIFESLPAPVLTLDALLFRLPASASLDDEAKERIKNRITLNNSISLLEERKYRLHKEDGKALRDKSRCPG